MRTRVLFAIIVETLGKNARSSRSSSPRRPRLERTAARRVRRFGVADFRDVTESSVVQMLIEWRKKSGARFFFRFGRGAAHAHPCFDECADQPRPDGALMINAIASREPPRSAARNPVRQARASADPTGVSKSISTASTTRRAFSCDNSMSGSPPTAKIWFGRNVRSTVPGLMIAIDHVGEITGVLVPESLFEGRAAFFEE